jgi:hypothetical protein
LVGPFKKVKGGFTHIFIAVDKFTKWTEVKPVVSITVAKAVEFIKEIVYRFGIPNYIMLITGLNSPRGSLKTSVQSRALRSTMPQCHTRRAMVKLSTQTA